MKYAEGDAVDWWTSLPPARVTRLAGVDLDILALSLEPLPENAPAMVLCRSVGNGPLAVQVGALVDELEQLAVTLFPAWLPGASDISGPAGLGVAAVRALAFELAARSRHFGPFVADLAEYALSGRRTPTGVFATEVRAAGLARVIAASYRRHTVALLVDVPPELSPEEQRILVAAAEWLAHRGGFAVWLVGGALTSVDRLDTVSVELPETLRRLDPGQPWQDDDVRPVLTVPAPTGAPDPSSPAERRLESILALEPWADGRSWNQPWRSGILAMTFRLDLLWAAERCVIEVDGPEHRSAAHYESDRSRDTQLVLAGFTVLRFTNRQVLTDVRMVVSQIETLISSRRPEKVDIQHGDG